MKFPDVPVPSKLCVHDFFAVFVRQEVFKTDRTRSVRPATLIPAFLESVSVPLQRSPKEPLIRLCQQLLDTSTSSCHRDTKRLKLQSYKVRVVQESGPERRIE